MSKSGQGPTIFLTFIDRKSKSEYEDQPQVTSLSFNPDMRQFTGTFDFEVQFGPAQNVEIASHDWVEFWTYVGNAKFQIGVGFVEDFVKTSSAAGVTLQGNGRDFLGQLMLCPFKTRVYKNGLTYRALLNTATEGSYLKDYLAFRNRPADLVDLGIFTQQMLFTDVATSPKAAVIQEYSELAMNVVYQDRLGRMTVYGRAKKNSGRTGLTLSAFRDLNVVEMTERQNFSKVYSQVTVIYSGEENIDVGVINAAHTQSGLVVNTDSRASGLGQNIYRVFSAQDLVGLAGNSSPQARIDELAKAIVRKSNQNLSQVIVKVDAPYAVTATGELVAYEIGQIWQLQNPAFELSAEYKLVGIQYQQGADSFMAQLAFVEPDTIV